MEVGKKYVLKSYREIGVLECLYVANTLAVLKNLKINSEFVAYKNNWNSYEEYKEPRTLKRYMVVYENGDGNANTFMSTETHPDMVKAQRDKTLWGFNVLDIVEINWVEKNV